MSHSYSKTQKELLVLIKELKNRCGDELKIRLIKLEQQNEYLMFSGKMAIDATYALLRRIPRDYDNPEGIQRALKESKVNNIVKIATEDSQRYSSPNAVVLTLSTEVEYASFEYHPDDKEMAYYKVDLNGLYSVIENAETDEDGFILDESDKFAGTLIDGHHRTAGQFEAGKMDFECPVTVYINLPKQAMAKVFADINQYQEKPSAVHTLAMKAIAGTLSSQEETANNISNLLNTEDWSILYQRIKDIDGKRPKGFLKPYVTNATFEKLIQQQVLYHLPSEMSIPRKARLLNDYFAAWSEVFDVAWQDDKTHVLVKSMGFQIMLRLFNVIHTKVSISGNPTKNDYKEFLQVNLKNSNEFKVGEQILPLDWSSEFFGSYSSGKGINAITHSLTQHISTEIYKVQQAAARKS
ncbi:DGQHR domain-containing protein [Peribacillus simplex]|uniref:DGQHR domain-containing protein n=1 Tax=Peribacillus simplex TaxID=1478 RepID=UPI0019235A91|nr:DGQHR domain-containing protein [Peribacillus simplex]MBD8590400.1 DGQHR domain-containing protein [Peribacillus simplex]